MLENLVKKLRARSSRRESTAAENFAALVTRAADGRLPDDAKSVASTEKTLSDDGRTIGDLETEVSRVLEARDLAATAGQFETRRSDLVGVRTELARLDDDFRLAAERYHGAHAEFSSRIAALQRELSESSQARDRLAAEFGDLPEGGTVVTENELRAACSRVESASGQRDRAVEKLAALRRTTNAEPARLSVAQNEVAAAENELSAAKSALAVAEQGFSEG